MTTVLSAGLSHSITEDVVYALPACNVRVTAKDAIEVSVNNSDWVAFTGANSGTGAETSGGWIRCTTANTVVSVKKV